ncbi:MAG: DNA mismatch repair protein MutS [bacterium]
MTPMMQQYTNIKQQHQDCILFFRLGDFYEMFLDDALLASRELEITLTSRDGGEQGKIPMCGVPYHSADSYIARLIEKGYKIAVCEQMEDPKQAKGIVKRDVIRIITPGTILDNQMLEEKTNNFLIAVFASGKEYGLATVDVSTGEFLTTEIKGEDALTKLTEEIIRLQPAECVLADDCAEDLKSLLKQFCLISYVEDRDFQFASASLCLTEHFGLKSLVGCDGLSLAVSAAGGLLAYLKMTQKCSLQHITKLVPYSTGTYMVLDPVTRKNLELSKTMHDRKKKGTVFWALDRTVTSMGGRMLQQWIEQPLLNIKDINLRLDSIEELINNVFLREDLKENLKNVYDLERLMTKIAYGTANARDLLMLRDSLTVLPKIKALLSKAKSSRLKFLEENLDCLSELNALITASVNEEPPVSVREGGIIKPGYSQEVDRLKEAQINGKIWLKELEAEEKAKTGIRNLKIGFNRVFGYYLEVSKSNIGLVPDYYLRKQTLANGERYVTEKLKEYEELLLGAEEKLIDLEYRLFTEIREKTAQEMKRVQKTAKTAAELDVLLSLSEVALNYNYCKPTVDNGEEIIIQEGRHLVIERLQSEQLFVPNDTLLNHQENELLLLTGPNMAGKSTYMRQTALIILLAQIGSFVPAKMAKIGLVDRIFTRIGAADDIITGQSTFMVEMQELANILSNATRKSFIILDEIGRGTSTYDGLSIAWAAVEYLQKKLQARTLFATHYHELTELADKLERVENYSVAVKEEKGEIIFLRKIVPGKVDRSYGVHVAKLAGLPASLLKRAAELLHELEKESRQETEPLQKKEEEKPVQMSLLAEPDNSVLSELRELDVLAMTPLEAINKLYELQKKAFKQG